MERTDDTAFSENLSDEDPAVIELPEALGHEKEQSSADPREVPANH